MRVIVYWFCLAVLRMQQVNGCEAPSVCVNILVVLPSFHHLSRAPVWPVHAFLWAVCSKEMKEFPPGV